MSVEMRTWLAAQGQRGLHVVELSGTRVHHGHADAREAAVVVAGIVVVEERSRAGRSRRRPFTSSCGSAAGLSHSSET